MSTLISGTNAPLSPADAATARVKDCIKAKTQAEAASAAGQFSDFEGPAKATLRFTFSPYLQDQYSLDDAGRRKLDEVAKAAACMEDYRIIIVGHSLCEGDSISERRANGAKDYLVSHGLAAHRIYAEGVRNRHPIEPVYRPASSLRAICPSVNWRIEIELIGTPKQ